VNKGIDLQKDVEAHHISGLQNEEWTNIDRAIRSALFSNI
jgi:hypothetical protein